MANIHKILYIVVIVVVSLVCIQGKAVNKRAVDATTEKSEVRICQNSTPCGWAVYIPTTRRVDYFMKNSCVCPTGLKCTRDNDDLSVSAYVYRCQ